MNIEEKSALLVIDIQQEDFKDMNENNFDAPEWACIRNARRVIDVFRAKGLPVVQIKEVHRPDMVDFGRELDGSESVHCIETSRIQTTPRSPIRRLAITSSPNGATARSSARIWRFF